MPMTKGARKFGSHYYEFDSSHELRQRALDRRAWLKRNSYQVRMTKGKLKYIDGDGRTRQFTIYRLWKWRIRSRRMRC